jgi:hypothetical protein
MTFIVWSLMGIFWAFSASSGGLFPALTRARVLDVVVYDDI